MSDYNKNEPDQPEEIGIGKKGGKQLQKTTMREEYRLIPVQESGYNDSDDEVFIDLVGIAKDLWVNKRTIITS